MYNIYAQSITHESNLNIGSGVQDNFSLNSIYPNYGYMGIPLCILAFGEMASIPISIILLIDTIVLLKVAVT